MSSLLVAFAQSYSQVMFLRYLLGVWEAVNFPICLLIISRIFPAGERSLASGIFASGAFLATLAAPPVVIYLSTAFNWRHSFVVSGGLGFFWLIPWLLIFRNPEKYSELWVRQTAHLKEVVVNSSLADYLKAYGMVLKQPGFWGVALIGLGIVPCLYFATLWFPTIFTQALNHPFDQTLSIRLSIIYFMQDLGLWIGGAMVMWLSRRHWDIMKSRKAVILFAWLLMMSILLTPVYNSITASVVIFSLFVFGLGAFLGNQHAFKQDVLSTHVATVSALVGFIETAFTFLVLRKIGVLTNLTNDFTVVYIILAILATFALAMVFLFMRPKWIKIY
jgi:ACS family hexuronate transporter-like MFS transporter